MSRSRHDAFHDCRFPLQLALRPQQEFDIATTVAPPGWAVKDAEKLYNMSGWGLGYFRVNADGHVTVHPDANRKRGLDLYHLATNGDDLDTLADHVDLIGHVQIADAPGRGEPGTGELDLFGHLAKLRANGYTGFVGAEYKPVTHSFAWRDNA